MRQFGTPDRAYLVSVQMADQKPVRSFRLAGVLPLPFRTKALDAFVDAKLADRARTIVANVPADLLARTAAFLLLRDSKSSYVIEGENPPQDRIQRWGRAIGEAGRQALDLGELLQLQRIKEMFACLMTQEISTASLT